MGDERLAALVEGSWRLFRASEFPREQVSRSALYRTKALSRVGPGLFLRAGDEVRSPRAGGAQVPAAHARVDPFALVQGLLPQRPAHDYWVTGHKVRLPAFRQPQARFLRTSLVQGDRVEVSVQGVAISCHSPLRALIDCIRFRKRLGERMVLQALRRALSSGSST